MYWGLICVILIRFCGCVGIGDGVIFVSNVIRNIEWVRFVVLSLFMR